VSLKEFHLCVCMCVCVKQETEVTVADVDGELASDLRHDVRLASGMLPLQLLPRI